MAKASPIIPLGSKYHLGEKVWTIAGVLWLGERYYLLTRGKTQVALLPGYFVEAGWR